MPSDTPTEKRRMGGGGRLTGRSDPLGRRLEYTYTDNPRTTAVDRRSDKWATRTSADASVPRLAGFSLITLI